jgi:hypothetical protein
LVHLATERPSPRQPSGWRGFIFAATDLLKDAFGGALTKVF